MWCKCWCVFCLWQLTFLFFSIYCYTFLFSTSTLEECLPININTSQRFFLGETPGMTPGHTWSDFQIRGRLNRKPRLCVLLEQAQTVLSPTTQSNHVFLRWPLGLVPSASIGNWHCSSPNSSLISLCSFSSFSI